MTVTVVVTDCVTVTISAGSVTVLVVVMVSAGRVLVTVTITGGAVTVLVLVMVTVSVGTGDGEGMGVDTVSGTHEKATAPLLLLLDRPRGAGQFASMHIVPLGQDASSQLRGARQETVRSFEGPFSSQTSPSGHVELVHIGEQTVT